MENTPAWQLIKNVVEGGTTKKTEIIKAILLVNPEMNKNTIRAQITVCTVNNPSRINFGQNKKPRAEHNQYDFLYQEDKSTVVLYDSNKHGNWVLEDDGGKTKVAKSDSNDVGNLDITCPECGSPIVYYWGDIDSDTYRAYNIDENADMIEEEEVDISPRMDRVDEVKDEFFYMCSNHDCGWDWKTKEEFLNGDDDDEENDEENVGEDKLSEFKEQEKVAVGFWEFKSLADSVANEYYLGDKDWARILYKKALESGDSFNDFNELCNDYLDDKSRFDEESFEKSFEKALGLKSNADEYDINSFADALEKAGETDKMEKLRS